MNALSRLLARFTFLRWMALLGLMLGATSSALAGKTYSDNGDGTVTDFNTGLVWMRCSMGQTWDGSTCTGTADTYSFNQANTLTGNVTFAGQSDWRVPNIRELTTIVDRSRYNPAIDPAAFPNMLNSYFVSSTRTTGFDSYVWGLSFYNGGASYGGPAQGSFFQVRLVRAGQSSGLLNIARPDTDYVIQGDGTVTHTPTKLIWQRCATGQTWTGSTCSGTAGTYTWYQAKLLTSNFAGKTDWRLPTEEELLSLVDYTKFYPATNYSLFPNAPYTYLFWSDSPYADGSASAWQVYFNLRNADDVSSRSEYNGVRLVRGGQSFGPITLTVEKTNGGQVASSVWPGIECGAVCTSGFYVGDLVTLNATPAANFISWGGACSGSNAICTVSMDAAKAVTASFMVAPVIAGLPTTLTFALQNIGSTSAAQRATLTNTGSAALNITSISASGDYSVLDNCGAGIGAGGSCTMDVTFTPVVSGIRSGTLTLITDAPGGPHTVGLSGTGQGAVASLSVSSMTFVNQSQGTHSAAQTITLSNPGGAVLNFHIAVDGQFGVSNTTCGTILAMGDNCSIDVTFDPPSVGAFSGSLVISSDAVSSPNTVNLSGTGIAAPVVSLNPTSLIFAAQAVGSGTSQMVKLTNTGGAALTLSVAASGDFSQTDNCGGGLGAAGFCDINVTFTPTSVGNRIGAITITSNAAVSPYSMVLSGTGVVPPVCSLSARPTRIQLGRSATLTASCNPAPTTYTWTGGTCAGSAASTCVVSPTLTTSYGVTGHYSYGSSTATADVTIGAVDLTPILMLLLD